jgi:nucleoside-diphosphate-sugar epimerase
MALKYLITGATGGLGAAVLAHLVASNTPASDYAAASSNEKNRKQFEDQGIAFRVANFDDPATLESAFQDVENLFFVSTNVFDTHRRTRQHRNVVEAARRAGVKHVRIIYIHAISCFGISWIIMIGRIDQQADFIFIHRCGIHLSPLVDSDPTRQWTCNKPI